MQAQFHLICGRKMSYRGLGKHQLDVFDCVFAHTAAIDIAKSRKD